MPILIANALTPDYGWNDDAGRYIDLSTGRFVPFSEVRDALEYNIAESQDEIHQLTKLLIDDDISLDDWLLGMSEQIKIAHTSAAASARGGWAQMTSSDWGAVGRMVRTQYEYLRNFANEIQNGKQPLNGSALVRADLYGQAARGSFEEMRRRMQRLAGMTEEIRILGEADHCEDCIKYANKWAPIGKLPRIGDSQCITNCHCRFRFRKFEGGKYIYGD